jgi:hypothetical protein
MQAFAVVEPIGKVKAEMSDFEDNIALIIACYAAVKLRFPSLNYDIGFLKRALMVLRCY